MIAYIAETQMKNIATLGFIGLAKAAAEIALITAAFQTAKAVINGFEEGGYTGSGRHDEPKGIVHAGVCGQPLRSPESSHPSGS